MSFWSDITGGQSIGTMIGNALTGGAVSNAQAVQQTNQAEIDLSNTAYQRAVGDMRKAGLNPMLAYSQGGASVPNLTPPQPGNIGAGLVEQGQKAFGDVQSLKMNDSQVSLNAANAEQSTAKAALADQQTDESAQNVSESKVRQKKLDAEAEVARQRARREANEADVSDAMQPARKALAPAQPWIDAGGNIAKGVANIAGAASSAKWLLNAGKPGGKNSSSAWELERLRRAGSRGIPTSGYSSVDHGDE